MLLILGIATLSPDNPTRIFFSKKLDEGKNKKYYSRIYQVYNHWHCLHKAPEHFNMIIRVRPDVVLYDHDWAGDIRKAYSHDRVYGYSTVKENGPEILPIGSLQTMS